ncbi:DNA-nicking Smr family endonuclease [Palleronia aestuarii]|uniref:DNA-nicking Smr family endonuclease n=1 Tax=Palleronia aestuarii TaxID=568105 RepID=A0A2W7P6F6_9RHOB|nr:Smr/MutS family protein [Palleronia aestuarii]PZX18982.1 DNA-nicking Smr family endonuclease [Palleronia aestuarii]
MARRREPRGLRPDELELWRQVKRTATPLREEPASPPPARLAPSPVRQNPQRPAFEIEPFRVGERTNSSRGPDPAPSVLPPVRMDAKAFGRMRRGKLRVEGRIDLHGLRLDEAHPLLLRFVRESQSAGKRLVLVITGKGQGGGEAPFPATRGVLRRQVPIWLASAPVAALVLQVTEAHRTHGGGGAYYVYLRRGGL